MNSNFPDSVSIKGRVRVCLELLKKQNIKNKVIVDIGSSFGWLEKEIINEKPRRIIGIEPNEDAVAFAKKNVKAEFVVGDALNIPLKDSCADIVILFDVLEHVPVNTEEKALKEAYRILKDRGILLLSTPNDNLFSNTLDPAWYFGHRHYSSDLIKSFLKQAGYELEGIKVRGNIISCLYLVWFYLLKSVMKIKSPSNDFIESLDDGGYEGEGILDIFLVARK
ncbi:MAG: class I SAM-dependent methyltransferase [Candidatus Daviesbacteria bacterium]|nr:class I SAM-dependent methyltransferase [Candidatus Daviesbacteria bacterium]